MQLGMVGLGRMGEHDRAPARARPRPQDLRPEGRVDRRRRSKSSAAARRAAGVLDDGARGSREAISRSSRRTSSRRHDHRRRNSYFRDDLRRGTDAGASRDPLRRRRRQRRHLGLERGYCLMVGGDEEAVKRLEPVFKTLAPGAATPHAGRTASRRRGEGLPPLRPDGRGPLREDGPQRDRVRPDAGVRRGLNILKHANVGLHAQETDAETTPLRDPDHYKYELDLPAIAEVWRRGSVVSLVAARPHRAGAEELAEPRRHTRPRRGLRRGPLDGAGRGRGGRAGAGARPRRSSTASRRADEAFDGATASCSASSAARIRRAAWRRARSSDRGRLSSSRRTRCSRGSRSGARPIRARS